MFMVFIIMFSILFGIPATGMIKVCRHKDADKMLTNVDKDGRMDTDLVRRVFLRSFTTKVSLLLLRRFGTIVRKYQSIPGGKIYNYKHQLPDASYYTEIYYYKETK